MTTQRRPSQVEDASGALLPGMTAWVDVLVCDGPGCSQQHVDDLPVHWLHLQRLGPTTMGLPDEYHFCGVPCLYAWADQ